VFTTAQLEQFASTYAKTPVTLSCDLASTFDTGVNGWVWFNLDGTVVPVIHLRKGLCGVLKNADSWAARSSDLPRAMLALGHEASHIADVNQNETSMACVSLSNRWQLVKLFRLPARLARWIMFYEIHADTELLPIYHAQPC
jgi:hypothetical protein